MRLGLEPVPPGLQSSPLIADEIFLASKDGKMRRGRSYFEALLALLVFVPSLVPAFSQAEGILEESLRAILDRD